MTKVIRDSFSENIYKKCGKCGLVRNVKEAPVCPNCEKPITQGRWEGRKERDVDIKEKSRP